MRFSAAEPAAPPNPTRGTVAAPGDAARVGRWRNSAPEGALLIVVGLWASTFVVTKGLYDELTPLAFTGVRFTLIVCLALGVMVLRGRRSGGGIPRIHRADLGRFALAGALGYTLYQLGFVLGLQRTSPFASSLLIAMVPLFTTVMLTIGGTPAPRRAWIGLAIVVMGVIIFLADKRGSGSARGDLLSLGAAVSFAGYGIVTRPLVRTYPPETYTAYSVVAGTIPLLLIATPAMLAQDWGGVSGRGWLAIVYLAIFPVYIAYQLWNWAIARRGVVAASGFSLLVPVVSGLLSAAVVGERFGLVKVVGAGLVLLGLLVLRRRPAR